MQAISTLYIMLKERTGCRIIVNNQTVQHPSFYADPVLGFPGWKALFCVNRIFAGKSGRVAKRLRTERSLRASGPQGYRATELQGYKDAECLRSLGIEVWRCMRSACALSEATGPQGLKATELQSACAPKIWRFGGAMVVAGRDRHERTLHGVKER